MRRSRLTIPLLAALLAVPVVARAESLEALVANAATATQAEQWEDALKWYDQAIAQHGKGNPMATYGPQFGAIYYRKGLAEMKLKKWADAMRSFEICYRDFPNKPGKPAANPFQKQALLKWGDAAMATEDWKLAAGRFAKFLTERDKTADTFPAGVLYINLAICHFRLGDIAEGSENLEIAVKNRRSFPTPANGIMAAFEALVKTVVEKHQEQALLDFVSNNRADLGFDDGMRFGHAQLFMKLAGDAIGAGMKRAAIAIYQLVPADDVAIDDLRARLKAMGSANSIVDGGHEWIRADLEADLTAFEADRHSARPLEATRLSAIAYLQEAAGNPRGAYAAHAQLARHFPAPENREENLFHLARLAALSNDAEHIREHAAAFAKEFPNSPKQLIVRQTLVTAAYRDGDFETVLKEAPGLLEKLEKGSAEHDRCLFVLAASTFHSGKEEQALPLLNEHASLYPKSEIAGDVAYLQAAANSHMGHTDEAAAQLDQLIDGGANSPYLAAALLDRARGLFESGKTPEALARLDRFFKSYPNSPLMGSAQLMAGDIERSGGNLPAAAKHYQAVVDAANAPVGDERSQALLRLIEIATSGSLPRPKDAVALADRFWKEFAEHSTLRMRIAIESAPAYVAVNRTEDALKHLRDEMNAKLPPAVLRELIGTYATAFGGEPAALKKHLLELPAVAASPLLKQDALLEVIATTQRALDNAPAGPAKEALIELRQASYQELKTRFPVKELSDEGLIRIARFLRTSSSTPRESLSFYEELLARPDSPFRYEARLGHADVVSDPPTSPEAAGALDDFTKVRSESPDAGERDYAWFREITVHSARGDHEKAIELGKLYLEHPGSFTARVKFAMANSYMATQRPADAMALYAELATPNNDLDVSAMSFLGWARLAEDAPSRQKLHEQVTRYLAATRDSAATAQPAVLASWNEVDQLARALALDPALQHPTQ